MLFRSDFEQRRVLNRDIWFDEVTTLDKNVIRDEVIALDFFPDGTASPAMITLANRRGQLMTLEILKGTGMAEITPGSIADKMEQERDDW